MTYKFITGSYPAGYSLSNAYTGLVIESGAYVGGVGVEALFDTTILNYGHVARSGFGSGILIEYGGSVANRSGGVVSGFYGVHIVNSKTPNPGMVVNSGVISGAYGVLISQNGGVANYQNSPIPSQASGGRIIGSSDGVKIAGGQGTVTNHGTIEGGAVGVSIDLGRIVNGSGVYTASTIDSGNIGVYAAGAATVTNFGAIRGANATAVYLKSGGVVINGGAADTAASIEGYFGVAISTGGSLVNFGTVSADARFQYGARVNGGMVKNGGGLDTSALISGAGGLKAFSGVLTVSNYGTIQGLYNDGVFLEQGGTLANGAAADTAALIDGLNSGVSANAAATVNNFATIRAVYSDGVYLKAGGLVTNGGGGDRSALIDGANGVVLVAGGTVRNFGSIAGLTAYGVQLLAGGALTNGSLNNRVALIEGYYGLRLAGAAAATNFGVISGTGDYGGAGAVVADGASLTNGAAGHAGATIEGFVGVTTNSGANTVINFGTISGAAGVAVQFGAASDVLVVEAGSVFDGQVLGDGGTLVLGSGTGTLALLAGDSLLVSKSMAATTFGDFATAEIGAGATFATAGAVSIAAGQTVIAAGTLSLRAAKTGVANAGIIEALGGTVTVAGAVTGAGHAIISGGTADFTASFSQNVTFSKTGTLELAQSQAYAGTISGFSKTGGTSLDLNDIAFGGSTKATYSGTKTGGVLTVTDGTHTAHITLKGNYLSSTFVVASDGHGGTSVQDPAKVAAPAGSSSPPWSSPSIHPFIAAAASFRGEAGAIGDIVGDASRPVARMLLAPRIQVA